MRLDLNPDESNFLYRLLDQVSVAGPQAKTMVLGIMLKLTEGQGAKSPVNDLAMEQGQDDPGPGGPARD